MILKRLHDKKFDMFKFKINSWDKRIVLYAMRVLTEHNKIEWTELGETLVSDSLMIERIEFDKHDKIVYVSFIDDSGIMTRAFKTYPNRDINKIFSFVKNKENRKYIKNEKKKTEELRKKLFDMFDKRTEVDYEL